MDVRYIEDALNKKLPSTARMSIEVKKKRDENPPALYVKHLYQVDGVPTEYATKINYSHYLKFGHEAFVDRLYKILMYRLDNKIREKYKKLNIQ